MPHDSDRRPHRGLGGGDPERSLLFAVRCALLPTFGLPAALAAALAGLAVVLNVVCWRAVIVRWRALPRRDDDGPGGPPRGWDGDDPKDPGGGPGGIAFDWVTFERDFRAYAAARERRAELVEA